jgi:predicted transcriptional regulator
MFPGNLKTVMRERVVDPQKVDPHFTTRIVASYVRRHEVRAAQVFELITSVHRALAQLGPLNQIEEVRTPAVTVRQSVRHEYVVCLDCGYRGKTLRRHINSQHGLNRDEYVNRWGLRSDHPLTAPAYSQQRSTLAKALGFGRKAKAEIVEAATPVVAATPVDAGAETQRAPSPKRRPRSRIKTDRCRQ